MDKPWIGRKLMFASRALTTRFVAAAPDDGLGEHILEPIAASLLREVGRSLALDEKDPGLPLLRARGLLKLPASRDQRELVRAFNSLGHFVREYLRNLPGNTLEIDGQARAGLRHAARATLGLHRMLLAGANAADWEKKFGFTVTLSYPPADRLAG